ncbi:MAG: hypothetical protein HY819_23260 [Acidobacteria bacterium]|nr:hypothetical protein [Acidobacteriota bacterium]
MNKVKIKKENSPTRCEICHKSDCFDFQNQNCSRCDGLDVLGEINTFEPLPENQYIRNVNLDFLGKVTNICISIGLFLGSTSGLIFCALLILDGGFFFSAIMMVFIWAALGGFLGIIIGIILTAIVSAISLFLRIVRLKNR